MKRLISLIMLALSFTFIFAMIPDSATSTVSDRACCQDFLVVNEAGNPIGGAVITIRHLPQLTCTTNNLGHCKICFTADAIYTADAVYLGSDPPLKGSATFEPCVQETVKIVVRPAK